MNPFDLTGPLFLLFYIIFSGFVIGGLVFWRRRAELSAAPPRVDLSDPYLIAYLRGGKPEVLRVATVALIDRGLLVQSGTNLERAPNASPDSVSRPIEKALLKKYARSGEASWMFEDDGLSKACESYGTTLRQAQLLPDELVNRRRLMRLIVACFLLLGVGLTKVVIALEAGRTNVRFPDRPDGDCDHCRSQTFDAPIDGKWQGHDRRRQESLRWIANSGGVGRFGSGGC